MSDAEAGQIRRASMADGERILDIATAELRLDLPGFHWHTGAEIARAIREGEYFVYTAADEITAIVSLKVRDDALWIETIAVSRAWQGQGQGRQMITFAGLVAARLGLAWLRVSTFRVYGAHDAYRRMGFRVYEETPDNLWLERPTGGGQRANRR
jgi:GNAT superfamily N-acetyltransferase